MHALSSQCLFCSVSRRIRDKYEAELKEIELSERNTQERYNEIKAKLADFEAENFRYQGLLKQKGQEVEDTKKVRKLE